jgi:hypothetical protein
MKSFKNIFFISILFLSSCTSKNDFENGKKQLETMGYTNVQNTGREWFCCDEKEAFSTGFSAIGKDSAIVTGCMCSSIGKSVTIRFNN